MLLCCTLFLFISLSLLIYAVLGMTLLPNDFREKLGKDVSFFISAPLGSAVWLALSVGVGMMCEYNRLTILVLLILAVVWVVWRRKCIFIPTNKFAWLAIFIIVLAGVLIGRVAGPFEINGGVYFSSSVYDHVKCAIIDSISRNGLLPLNPWLSDAGKPLPMVYYFGWHAWAAQLPILTGCSSYFVEYAQTGATSAIISTGIIGLAKLYKIPYGYIGVFFLLFLLFVGDLWTAVLDAILPQSVLDLLATKGLPGFWTLIDNFLWSPQHMFGAFCVLLFALVFDKFLDGGSKKLSLSYASLIGLLCASAFLTSIYAGIFCIVIIAAFVLWDFAFDKKFRVSFLKIFLWVCLAILIFLILTVPYIKLLLQYPSEQVPLAFGVVPCYAPIEHWWDYVFCFFHFYLYLLTTKLGLPYLIGFIAIFTHGLLPKTRFNKIVVRLIVSSFILIFFIHSSYYSNDFGWRLISFAPFVLTIFAAIFLLKIFESAKNKCGWRRVVCYLVPLFIVVLQTLSMLKFSENFGLNFKESPIHQTFLRATKGWDVVRAHTSKTELVLCNPSGFYEIGALHNAKNYSTNIFYSLYSQRDTPISDLIFSKCYSEFFDQKKIDERYNRVCKIFKGEVERADLDYLADDLCAKAILITPLDALWNNSDVLLKRYPKVFETSDYKVYLKQ